jgi:hypothetical protein
MFWLLGKFFEWWHKPPTEECYEKMRKRAVEKITAKMELKKKIKKSVD